MVSNVPGENYQVYQNWQVYLLQNVLRTHYQRTIWKSCLEVDLPLLDPTDACISLEEHYFKKIQSAALQYVSAEVDQILEPITVSEDINMVPIEVLRTLGCKCKSVRPYKRGNCAYKAFQLSWILFCKCDDGKCFNEWTINKTLIQKRLNSIRFVATDCSPSKICQNTGFLWTVYSCKRTGS